MLQKLFFCGMVMVCLVGIANLTYAQANTPVKIITKGDVLVGANSRAVRTTNYVAPISKVDPIQYSVNAVTWTISELDTNARSVYDLQSNGVCRYIYQEPGTPLNLHACFMTAKDGPYATRNTPAFYSNDGGATWTFLGNPNSARAGFGCVGATSDGRTIVANHSAPTGTDVRTVLFIDIAPGVGSFQIVDPGLQAPTGADQPIWPYFTVSTGNHIPFIASKNAAETTYVNVCTNITPPGTFNGYHAVNEASNAESYNIASDGNKVGVVYITGSFSVHPDGSVYYIESNDNGLTYGTPQQVWLANYSSTGDSIGALRDVDITFLNGQPRVVMGLCHQTGDGSFFPGRPAQIRFWSPNINGGVPVLIDSSDGLTGSTPTNDVFVGVTRAVIGKSADNNAIYVAWNRARPDTDAVGNNFFDVWYAYSSDGGATWLGKTQITNNPTPPPSVGLRDCRYPSISPTNNVGAPYHYTYLVFPSDSIPASSVNGAVMSWSRMMFCKISNNAPIGVQNIGTEVPGVYSLNQNYPNPFNPSTMIKFALPKSSFVSLKVYDLSGREVAVLINQNLDAGNKEYEFNATNLASGVYFYTLKAGDFTDTKKMVLVK